MKAINNLKAFSLIIFAIGIFSFSIMGQSSYLVLKKGKAVVKKTLVPKKENQTQVFTFRARKGQTLDVKVNYSSVKLNEENECGVAFMIYDNKKRLLTVGDYVDGGPDEWTGKIKKTGVHRMEVFMGCLEAYTVEDLQKKKPRFRYSLEILLK